MALISKVGKSLLSMYLRTNCDRELYFSLYKSTSPNHLVAAGMPAPLSARPNIQLVTKAGVEFEDHEYQMLVDLFGSGAVKHKLVGGKFKDIDLKLELRRVSTPGFCLQPSLDPEQFRTQLLCDELGLSATQAAQIPTLQGMRPDIILVRERGELRWEVQANGKRKQLSDADARTALSVVDVKNTAEGNKSYAAEVVLYSIVLAKWLAIEGLTGDYFVSDECFLWTHQERPALNALQPGAPLEVKFGTVITTLEQVEFAVIAPSVVKFLTQDLLRVLDTAAASGWQAIDYHVCGLCSNCDWLGYERWLSVKDKKLYDANPSWYCRRAAKDVDHLSQLPHLSKGARQVLEGAGTNNLTELSGLPIGAGVLKTHSFLKREKSHIALRAEAIRTTTSSVDNSAALAGLASGVDLQISIVINFDAAAGLLTGIAARSTLFGVFGSANAVRQLGRLEVTVDNNTLSSEWDTLYIFLEYLQNVVRSAERHRRDDGVTPVAPKTQIYIWEKRQFEELCAAVGRHLPTILSQPKGNLLPAMAWLFPPDELMRRKSSVSPHIIFVGDVAQRVLRTTAPHAFTLWSTFEDYHPVAITPPYMDPYYVDPFGNGIPRERIFEVWKNNGTIRSGGTLKTKSKASSDYAHALSLQALALGAITSRLRTDFRGQLKGDAVRLDIAVLRGPVNVAFDSKIWIEWAKVSAKTAEMEREAEFTLPAEVLEASYKALVLTNISARTSSGTYLCHVSPESREAKLDDTGSYYVLGDARKPGLPLATSKELGVPTPRASEDMSPEEWAAYRSALHQLLRVRLVSFDRENLTAEIQLLPRNSNSAEQQVALATLETGGYLPLTGELFLMSGMPYGDVKSVEGILRAVGSPSCATPTPAAARAMGVSQGTRAGNSPMTPLASVLWQADALVANTVRSAIESNTLADRAVFFSGQPVAEYALDASQRQAIADLAQQQLSLVWGPPGTGKTSTLVAYLLAIVEEAHLRGVNKKILVTGPNYRAVEVLVHKLLEKLNLFPALVTDLFMVYSRTRPVVELPEPPAAHLNAQALSLSDAVSVADLRNAINRPGISIFGTSAHTADKLAQALHDTEDYLVPTFDLVIIDESSQVPLTLALNPLATLQPRAEVVIAGDPKQMPPIQALAPPAGAEYLVGSIHNYLTTRFGITEQKLLWNYRSSQDLVDYAKTLGYPLDLEAKQPDLRIELLQPLTSVALPTSLLISPIVRQALNAILEPAKVATALLYDDTQSSQANLAEARKVAAMAFILFQTAAQQLAPQPSGTIFLPFTEEEFFRIGLGVVTPHKAQRALVISEISKVFPLVPYEKLQQAVDTVERFQGGERHTIIVSYGVGDVDVIQGEEEFLMQMERTNVAISRAMAKCIVIMPRTLAYHLPNDSKVTKAAVALKSYLEEFCENRVVYPINTTTSVEIRWK